MSYANMDGVPTQTAGTSEILASDWNTYVRDNFDSIKYGHIVCTSNTRPTGVAEGTMIYETDTNKVLVYNGSSWVEVSDLDSADGLSASGQTKLDKTDNIGLIFINKASFSAATTVNVNNVFSSTYESYRIIFRAEGTVTGFGTQGFMRLRASGSDSPGSYIRQRLVQTNTTISGQDSLAVSYWNDIPGSVDTLTGLTTIDIARPAVVGPTSIISHHGSNGQQLLCTGQHTVSAAYDGFSFFVFSGNMTGTIHVYGYKES